MFFLYGSDYLVLKSRVEELKTELGNSSGLTIRNFTLQKSDDVDSFLNQPTNLSLFSESFFDVIEINSRAFNQLEKETEHFINILNTRSLSSHSVVVFYVDKLDKSLAKKNSDNVLFKQLKNISVFEEYYKLMPWNTEQIKERVIKYSKKYNLKFDSESLNLYVEHIKENLENLDSELKSIQLYLLPNNVIDKKCIFDLLEADVNIDDLYNSLLFNKPAYFSKLHLMLAKYNSSLYILAVLQNKFRQALSVISSLSLNISIYQISKTFGINLYKLEKDINKLRSISPVHIYKIIEKLSVLELKLKTGFITEKRILDLILVECLVV